MKFPEAAAGEVIGNSDGAGGNKYRRCFEFEARLLGCNEVVDREILRN